MTYPHMQNLSGEAKAEADQGKVGGERVSIVARSRIRLAVVASSGEKLSISKEMSKSSPTQFAGGKK